MLAPKRIVFVVLMLVAAVFWASAILSASSSGFFENEWAVETMVLGGAISMVAATIGEFW